MAILDVSPIDEAADLRLNSQYLRDVSRSASPVPGNIFIDSNPEQWREEWNQAWALAHKLSTSLADRARQDGLVMGTTDPATLRRPTSKSLLRRLVQLLSISSRHGVDPITMQSNFPQVVIVDYTGGNSGSDVPEVTNLSSPRAMFAFLNSTTLMRDENMTSRLIFINLGRHDPDMVKPWNQDTAFDYSLVWLGALFEVLKISSDILLCANLEDYTDSFGEHYVQKLWLTHNLPPSAVREMETAAEPWRTWGFFVPFSSKRANHHTSRKLTDESPDLRIRPTLVVSHFQQTQNTSATTRLWTGICVAPSSESLYLREGDYPTENYLAEAIQYLKFSHTSITEDFTKPMFHVFTMCVATLLEYLAEVHQFLISYEEMIRRRPLEVDGHRLFHVAKDLRRIEALSIEYRLSMKRFPRGDICSVDNSWITVAMADLDFLDSRNQAMCVRLSETRTLLFNHVSIMESQSISRLTKIAFVFIPATFVATVFGTNVSAFAGDGPSIGLLFGVAAGVCILTWIFSLGFTPLMAEVRKKQSHISRRIIFRRYLTEMRKAHKEEVKIGSSQELYQAALEEKKASHHVITHLIDRSKARSKLQDLVNATLTQQAAFNAQGREEQVVSTDGG